MWWSCKTEPSEYDPDRKVTLTIGRLVDALADALKVVEDDAGSPVFKVGDEFHARIKVTGAQDDIVNFVFAGDEGHDRSSHNINRYRLSQIKESA